MLDSLPQTPLTLCPALCRYLVYNILMQGSTCVQWSMQCVLMEWTAVQLLLSLEAFSLTFQVQMYIHVFFVFVYNIMSFNLIIFLYSYIFLLCGVLYT